MVCPRCIKAVEKTMTDLKIDFMAIELGSVQLIEKLSEQQKSEFGFKLNELGFELLETNKSKLISKLKTLIIKQVHLLHNIFVNSQFVHCKSLACQLNIQREMILPSLF